MTNTVKVFFFVDANSHMHGWSKLPVIVDSYIRGFIIGPKNNGNFVFRWTLYFVVLMKHEIHKKLALHKL